MEKKNVFFVLIGLVVAIFALMIAIKLIFKSDSVNEGKFRVTDVLVTSTAVVENKNEQNEFWSIDLSQKNKLSVLITASSGAEISKISLKNIRADKDNILIYQDDSENKLKLNDAKDELDIEYTVRENDQILVELNIINENILKNWKVPENIKEIIYDGRILKTAGKSLKDIKFNLKFNLIITEKTGKENVMKVNLDFPNEELLNNGSDVRRLPISEFRFKTL